MKELYAIVNKRPPRFVDKHQELAIVSKPDSLNEAVYTKSEKDKALEHKQQLKEEYNHSDFEVVNLTVARYRSVETKEQAIEQAQHYLGKAISKFQEAGKPDIFEELEAILKRNKNLEKVIQ